MATPIGQVSPAPQSGDIATPTWKGWLIALVAYLNKGTQMPAQVNVLSSTTWTAAARGVAVVQGGGTLASVHLTRSGTVVVLAALAGIPIPVCAGDTLTITSSTAATIIFIPQ